MNMEVCFPTVSPSGVLGIGSTTNEISFSKQNSVQRDTAKRAISSSESTVETVSTQEDFAEGTCLESIENCENADDCGSDAAAIVSDSLEEAEEHDKCKVGAREYGPYSITNTSSMDNNYDNPQHLCLEQDEYNFKHFLHYLNTHVAKSNLLEHRDTIEAMIEDGKDIDEIRKELIIRNKCPRLFVEAILIDQYRIYLRTQSMIVAKVDPEKIFHVMTQDEGGDEELVKSLILAGYGHASTRGVLKFNAALNQRDPRAFRLVGRMVLEEKVKFMLRVGVPEGAIRQDLARKGWVNPVIDDMLKRATQQSNSQVKFKDGCVLYDKEKGNHQDVLHSGGSHSEADFCHETLSDVRSFDTDDDDEDYCSPPAGTTSEEDSKSRLRTAVYRKVKEMVEEGKSDVEIRVELVAMKCVEPSLVECFIEESHDQDGREHSELDEESLKALDSTIPNLIDHKTEMKILSDKKPTLDGHHPLLVPGATLKQRQMKVKLIKKILMLQQAHVSPEAIHERFRDHPMVNSDLIDVVLHHGAERISNSSNKTPRTPSELIRSDPISGDGCLFQKLRQIFASGKCPFQS